MLLLSGAVIFLPRTQRNRGTEDEVGSGGGWRAERLRERENFQLDQVPFKDQLYFSAFKFHEKNIQFF